MQDITNFSGRVPSRRKQRTVPTFFPAALFLCLCTPIDLPAQQTSSGAAAIESQSPSSTIKGTVRDERGAVLGGVEVRVQGQDDVSREKQATDSNGAFAFPNLPSGVYRLTINVAGLQPYTSEPLTLDTGAQLEVPVVATRLATKMTTVNVHASLNEVAEAQVKEQEKQRLIGLLPNYYTSYKWDAVPMTPKLKFDMALRTVTDPVSFLAVAGIAGVEQKHKTFPGYGQGAQGYAKRFGSTYADTVATRMLGSAVFPILFHQDPRYFYRGSGSVKSRLGYALMSAVICRGDNGQLQPSYSHVLGGFAAAGISNLYKSPQDRQVGLTLRNGLIITGAAAGVNVMREFLFRKMTTNVPPSRNGKP